MKSTTKRKRSVAFMRATEPNQTQRKFTPCSNIYLMDENCLAGEQLANELFGNFWDYYWREESSETHWNGTVPYWWWNPVLGIFGVRWKSNPYLCYSWKRKWTHIFHLSVFEQFFSSTNTNNSIKCSTLSLYLDAICETRALVRLAVRESNPQIMCSDVVRFTIEMCGTFKPIQTRNQPKCSCSD